MDEVRLGVVAEDVAEGDLPLQGHDVLRVAGGRVERRGQAGRGVRVVLADAAAALCAAGVDPVVLVDLLGRPARVVEDVHRVARDRRGGADLSLAGLAGVVRGQPADAGVGEGERQVGVVGRLLRQHPQSGVLSGHQLIVGQRQLGLLPPHLIVGDLVGDVGAADPLGAAVGVGGAPPRHHRGVLFAAEEGVRVGVVDPAELGAFGDEPVGRRVGSVVVLAVVDAAGAVVGEVEGEVALALPGDGVVDVGGRHPDRVGRGIGVGAVHVAGCAVERGVPAVVGREHVVDVYGEVVAGGAQVHPAGHPLDDAAGEQPELLLVLVVDEGDDEFTPPVVPVLPHQRALLARARDRRLDVGGEVGAGHRGRQEGVTLADGGRVVLEGHRTVEVVERTRPPGVRHLGLHAVDAARVAAVHRVLESGLGAGVRVRVDLRDVVGLLVGHQGGHLGRVRGERVVVGQDDRLELGAVPAVHGVREISGIDHRAAGLREVDLRVRGSRGVQFGGDGVGGRAAIADDEHPQVDAGRRRVRGVCGRYTEGGYERARREQSGA